LTLAGLPVIFLRMVRAKIGKNFKKVWGLPGFFLTLVLLGGCGYPSPTPGGGLTPYVVVVTPTSLPSTITAAAQATFAAAPTNSAAPRSSSTASAATPSPPSTPASAKPTPTLAVSADNKYTVQPGDTLFGIAIRLGVDFDDLVSINNIDDPNVLKIGQVLKIPPRKATPTSAGTATKKP
jgi:LysM repeat protein